LFDLIFTLKDLVLARPDARVAEIMQANPASVSTHDDQEEASAKLQHYDLLALPVVDTEGRLVGIVTVDDIIDILLPPASKKKRRKV